MNLFSRLANYSQNQSKRSVENFTTELLAHFFNDDIRFRRRFLQLIMADGRSIRAYVSGNALTQQSLSSNCRVDLVLQSGARKHLVEVKISAQETWGRAPGEDWSPQVQRYLDLRIGHVSYLTTRHAADPITDNRGRRFRFVKHARFEDLHQALQPLRGNPLLSTFLDFMEANDMAHPLSLSPQDVQQADRSLTTYYKCEEALDAVRIAIGEQFRRNLNTRSSLTRPGFSHGPGWTSIYSYLGGYQRGPVRRIGISLDPERDELYFNVWLWGAMDPDMNRLGKTLGWEEYTTGRGYAAGIRLKGNVGDFERMKRLALIESRRLGRAIRRVI